MGNDLPKMSKVKDQNICYELRKIPYDQLRECIYLWKNDFQRVVLIDQYSFEDLFGHLVKDPDLVFNLFKFNERVEVLEFLSVSMLMSSYESAGVSFVENIKNIITLTVKSIDEITKEQMCNIFRAVVVGFSHIFNIHPLTTTEIDQYVCSTGLKFYRSVPIKNEYDNSEEQKFTDVDGISFEDVWVWFQDSKSIAKFLDSILALHSDENQHILLKIAEQTMKLDDDNGEDSYNLDDSSSSVIDILMPTKYTIRKPKETGNMAAVISQRRTHPLWKTFIMDMVTEDWITPLPYVTTDDCVFTLLEHILLGDYMALSVVETASQGGQGVVGSFDDLSNPRRLKGSDPRDRANTVAVYSSAQASQQNASSFVGIIDLVDILAWFADNIPLNLGSNITANKIIAASCITQGASDTALESTGIRRHSTVKFSNTANPLALSRARRMSANSQQGAIKIWQECGYRMGLSPIKEVFDQSLCPSNAASPVFTNHQILPTSTQFYNVLYLYSLGYRHIPVSTTDSNPYKVNRIISEQDIIQFLLDHPDLLGTLFRTPLRRAMSLVKIAITIGADLSLGAAIQSLAKFKTDSAVIVDANSRVLGRFPASVCREMYLQWRTQLNVRQGKELNLNELKTDYKNPTALYTTMDYSEFQEEKTGITGAVLSAYAWFSNFSVLTHPLKVCDCLGSPLCSLEDYVTLGNDKQTILEDDSESESDASTSSSESNKSKSPKKRGRGSPATIGGHNTKSHAKEPTKKVEVINEAKLAQRRKIEWFRNMGAVLLTDTVGAALMAMRHVKSGRAFVISQDGALEGVVSLLSICYELLRSEFQYKNMEMMRIERDGTM